MWDMPSVMHISVCHAGDAALEYSCERGHFDQLTSERHVTTTQHAKCSHVRCSNVRDFLGFINAVIVHPKALNLTTEAVTSLTTPIVVPLLSNGSMNTNFTEGKGFAKGVSTFGNPGEPHGVSLQSRPAPCSGFHAAIPMTQGKWPASMQAVPSLRGPFGILPFSSQLSGNLQARMVRGS